MWYDNQQVLQLHHFWLIYHWVPVQMTLPMFSHAGKPLFSQISWKSRGAMFEIFTLLFLLFWHRGSKNCPNMKKYISKWSLGSELYWGISVFNPNWWLKVKKKLRRDDENHRVLEATFPGLPSCPIPCFLGIGDHEIDLYDYKHMSELINLLKHTTLVKQTGRSVFMYAD